MTYTIMAADPDAGLLAVATASRSLAVGNSVPALAPGIGAVASQAHTDRDLRARVLTGLRAGQSPAQVIDYLGTSRASLHERQLGVIDAAGRAATHTGAGCSGWAGSQVGDRHAVLGNLLTGPEVLEAMTVSFARKPEAPQTGDASWAREGSLPLRLLDCLRAGRDAGGDRRGQQSAAMLVVDRRAIDHAPPSMLIDLRVDDHPDPIEELARLLSLRLQLGRDWLVRDSVRPV